LEYRHSPGGAEQRLEANNYHVARGKSFMGVGIAAEDYRNAHRSCNFPVRDVSTYRGTPNACRPFQVTYK